VQLWYFIWNDIDNCSANREKTAVAAGRTRIASGVLIDAGCREWAKYVDTDKLLGTQARNSRAERARRTPLQSAWLKRTPIIHKPTRQPSCLLGICCQVGSELQHWRACTELTVPGQHRQLHWLANGKRTTQYLGRETVPRWVCERFSQGFTMCTSVQTDIVSFTIIHDLQRAHGST
jgi:hypothetical protein